MHLHDLTIKKFHAGLVSGEFKALEVTQEYLRSIEARNPEIGAYLAVTSDLAVTAAHAADLKVARGESVGVLEGVPIALKDNMAAKGVRTGAASKVLGGYRASYDATVVAKLGALGAVFLGKTNMDEFAMGSSTENSAYQKTKNPRDVSRVPGGSSGGSAAAVAGDLALASLGSDTGGSIRQPAAFCGVVGLKPTYGAVSRSGLIAMSSSLDQIGPIAKTVEDAAIIFQAIAGKDPLDATTADSKDGGEIESLTLEDVRELRVGLPKEYFTGGLEPGVAEGVERAVEALKSLGVSFREVSLPHTKYALSTYYIIMPAEVSSNLARYDGVRYERPGESVEKLSELYKKARESGFGAEVKRRAILGTFVLSSGYYDAYYAKAQKVRTLIARDFSEAFEDVDILLTPVAPTRAFKFGEKTKDPLSMYLSDVFTIPASLAGVPAISIPVKAKNPGELPVGFQLIGKPWREVDILGLGQYYERL
jgi:aspartyl-tRNA(Asn)/glutamyl-tRNA(Gln) amidotransferase subunit A